MNHETTDTNATDNASGISAQADRTPAGGRINQVWDFLRRERVGDELIFTSEYAAQIKNETGASTGVIYDALTRLSAKGLLTKKQLAKGKGIMLTFVSGASASKSSRNGAKKAVAGEVDPITLIRAKVESEILELEAKLTAKKQFLAQLSVYAKGAK